ncbi:hypothetical protein C8J57DRAFT_1732601 [Mycena rebaudengoi]|nr:hypothetical protein C8J57DRAFT_1732601 [Mycena rebaudengoi]
MSSPLTPGVSGKPKGKHGGARPSAGRPRKTQILGTPQSIATRVLPARASCSQSARGAASINLSSCSNPSVPPGNHTSCSCPANTHSPAAQTIVRSRTEASRSTADLPGETSNTQRDAQQSSAPGTQTTECSSESRGSILRQKLLSVKKRLLLEIEAHGVPLCYQRGDFYDRPPHPVFAAKLGVLSTGVDPSTLYGCQVFVWLPHLLPGCPETFKCTCGKPLSRNGVDPAPPEAGQIDFSASVGDSNDVASRDVAPVVQRDDNQIERTPNGISVQDTGMRMVVQPSTTQFSPPAQQEQPQPLQWGYLLPTREGATSVPATEITFYTTSLFHAPYDPSFTMVQTRSTILFLSAALLPLLAVAAPAAVKQPAKRAAVPAASGSTAPSGGLSTSDQPVSTEPVTQPAPASSALVARAKRQANPTATASTDPTATGSGPAVPSSDQSNPTATASAAPSASVAPDPVPSATATATAAGRSKNL